MARDEADFQPESTTLASEPASGARAIDIGGENIGRFERLASVAVGSALAIHCLARRTWPSTIAGLIGAGLIYRGLTGHCALYQALGIDTCSIHRDREEADQEGMRDTWSEVERSIQVNRALEDLFAFWRKLENLPRFITHLESVRVDLSGRSHWMASGPRGARAEWDARFVAERENDLLAWESVPGSSIECRGSVKFQSLSPETTEVTVRFEYPRSIVPGMPLAAILGREPAMQLEEDLRHWKKIMEAGD